MLYESQIDIPIPTVNCVFCCLFNIINKKIIGIFVYTKNNLRAWKEAHSNCLRFFVLLFQV